MAELLKKFYLDRERILLLVRYGISGMIGIITQTSVLFVWVSALHFETHYLWGSILGLLIAMCITFLLQKYWTFKDKTHHTVHIQFVSYALIAMCNLGLNTLLLHFSKVLVDGFGLDFFAGWYLVCQILVTGFVAAMSFFANYFITFRSHTRKQ